MQQHHRYVETAKKGELVAVKVPGTVRSGDKVFLWRKKDRFVA
jgi:hypothetical protein